MRGEDILLIVALIAILPEQAACLPVAAIVASRDKKLEREIARRRLRKGPVQREFRLITGR